jgi:hypothetical protein
VRRLSSILRGCSWRWRSRSRDLLQRLHLRRAAGGLRFLRDFTVRVVGENERQPVEFLMDGILARDAAQRLDLACGQGREGELALAGKGRHGHAAQQRRRETDAPGVQREHAAVALDLEFVDGVGFHGSGIAQRTVIGVAVGQRPGLGGDFDLFLARREGQCNRDLQWLCFRDHNRALDGAESAQRDPQRILAGRESAELGLSIRPGFRSNGSLRACAQLHQRGRGGSAARIGHFHNENRRVRAKTGGTTECKKDQGYKKVSGHYRIPKISIISREYGSRRMN